MKKIIFLLLLALSIQTFAQTDPNRLASTKIVDALAQFPAANQKAYNSIMSDIQSTGNEGIEILIKKLVAADESLNSVEYALNGYCAYAAGKDFDASQRQSLIDLLVKTRKELKGQLSGDDAKDAKENPKTFSTVKFIERQLMVLGQTKVDIETVEEKTSEQYASLIDQSKKTIKKDASYQNKAILYSAIRDYIKTAGISAAEKVIMTSLKDKSREVRFAAINAVNDYGKKDEIKALFDKIAPALSKYSDETQKDLTYWFSQYPDFADANAITALLSSKNNDVVASAAWALTRINKQESVKEIASLIASNDENKIALAESCLKCFKGNVTDEVASLKDLDCKGQVAVINLIASRKDYKYSSTIFDSLKSSDKAVKDAAYKALSLISCKNDLKALYSILESCTNKEYIIDVQNGLNTALSTISDKKQRYTAIEAQRVAAGKDKENLYWPVVFKNADNLQLLAICGKIESGDLKSQALQAYLGTIGTNLKPEQQLLMYRNALEFSQNDNEKVQILDKIGDTGTFLGMMIAGQYIDNAGTQQAAAQAVRKIASANSTIYGPEIKQLLEKAKSVISGADADYHKTELQNCINEMAKKTDCGFVSLFNGKDLTGWKGLLDSPYDNPYKRAQLSAEELKVKQSEADELMKQTWSVEDGCILFNGKGHSLCTDKQYENFEMYIDWKLFDGPEPDAGIYLRGTPQVQIWDTSRVNVGAQVGSGGLYNNSKNNNPLKVADNGVGQWNSFYIKMVGERVTVYLNGELVVNDIIMENYWNRSLPILMKEQIELQAHGSKVAYRDIYIHELPSIKPYTLSKEEEKEGFKMLFDGTNLKNWQGDLVSYTTDENGCISVSPKPGSSGGNLYTKEQYSDFILRFEFKLTEGANNGVGIRAEMGKDAAYYGMEIQVLDHYNKIYQPDLHDYQYHGSVYGIIPTQNRDQLKPVGEWNVEEIYAKGNHIKVTLNGVVITEGDIKEATKNGNYDGKNHPGLFNKTGYIGFLGHGSILWYRNVRIKNLEKKTK